MKSDFLILWGNHSLRSWGSHYKTPSWWSWRSQSSRCWPGSRHSQTVKRIQSFGALWKKSNFCRESQSPWVCPNTDSEKYSCQFHDFIYYIWHSITKSDLACRTYFCIILPDKSYENVKYIFLRFYWFKIFFCLAILISSLYSKA